MTTKGEDMPDQPLVGILMGSQSDAHVMDEAAKELDALGIAYEVNVLSAHRDPEAVREYGLNAAGRGLKIIIAGAGKAAALPGVVAALTPLPVIGVPIRTSDLGGLDSLLSMVQMPPGVPVATMAINGARNAAILAAKILRVAGLAGEPLSGTKPGAAVEPDAAAVELGALAEGGVVAGGAVLGAAKPVATSAEPIATVEGGPL
jgi:5-(carboxyamino)imidazole ribonucleotide mutase